jgi:Ca-activated chloride channel family protein
MSQWYFSRQGQTFGPYTTRELRDLAKAGKLGPDDLVSQPGAKSWHAASTIRGLFDELAPQPAPPPPPVSRPAPAPTPVSTAPANILTPIAAPTAEAPAVKRGAFTALLLALPKPILFGLFGGLGGLLGAVLLAELLFLLLSPADIGSQPSLQVGVPDVVRTYQGSKNRFLVKIARRNFNTPVLVETSVASTDITAPTVTIPADKDQAEVEVAAPKKTDPKVYPLSVKISCPEQKSIKPETREVKLSVEPVPPVVSVSASREVSVEQGGRGRFTVRIARGRFNEEVALRFAGAPEGVTFLPATVVIPVEKSETTVDVAATASAPRMVTPVTVKATARASGTDIAGEAKFNLTVKERSPPTVDVVFVLDLTGSMGFAIEGIKRGIQSFLEGLERDRLDARIGIICFRDIDPPPAGDNERPYALMFPTPDGGMDAFTRDYRAARDKVATLRAGGGGDEPESSLQALALAAQQKFRPNAARVFILITDAPPKIHPREVPSTVKETVEELTKKEIDQVHLVVHTRHLDRDTFGPFKDAFKGSHFDIARSTTGNAFADLLPSLSKSISKITISSPPRGSASAAEPPPLPEASTDSLPPATSVPTLKAVQSEKKYAKEDQFRVLIAVVVWTLVVAGAISLLLLAGQQFHARQSWVGLSEGTWAVLGGVVAGLAGGGIGQLVFQSTSGAPSWEWAGYILGWSFLGGLIGVLLAFFVPNLKWHRGGLGGLVGGIFGAVAFLAVTVMLGSLLGRWLGAAILGFCLGLMVALAELAFRRFWLEIAVSPREVRTMTLGATAISLGSDERRSSFFIAGAAPVALRYWVDGEEVCCEDVPSGQTTRVAAGESRQIGRVMVTMRSVAASRQTGYVLELVGGRKLQLQEGMPLTAEDLPGLEPKGTDGMVALVSGQPNRPQEMMLRNRSKQSWTAWDAAGNKQMIDPGRGIELAVGARVDFGQVQGTIQRAEETRMVRR